jgi:hypothetical protein
VACGAPLSERLAAAGAAHGGLEQLQWLRSIGCPWDARVITSAAIGGHQAVVRWALEHGCALDKEAACALARDEYLAELQLAHARACPWYWYGFTTAIRQGQLGAVQWMHANGCCPWDKGEIFDAIYSGQLAVLQWLVANGCPHDPKHSIGTCFHAARAGQLEVLKWLCKEGFRMYSEWLLEVAQEHGHVAMCKWIRANDHHYDPWAMSRIYTYAYAQKAAEDATRKERKLLKSLHWGLSR